MKNGVEVIGNVPLLYYPEGLGGRLDLIERKDTHKSLLGDYHYQVREIKVAKNIQDYHQAQTGFYNYLLGKIQGYAPKTVILINRECEEQETPYDETYITDIIHEIRGIIDGKKPTPTYGHSDYPWANYTDEEAIQTKDVSVVCQVGPVTKEKFVEAGYLTYPEIAVLNPSDLTHIKGISLAKAKKIVNKAKALVQETYFKHSSPKFSEASTEIFVDLEGTGILKSGEDLIDIIFLIGVLVRTKNSEKYIPFIAMILEKEEEMFKNFINWIQKQKDYVIYHWHQYERTHLTKLAEKYGVSAEIELFKKLRDLYKDATENFTFPTPGNGLKEIASYMGFSWRLEDVSATESIALYLEYIKDPKKKKDLLQKILTYNEDDCIATRIVKDWLLKHA